MMKKLLLIIAFLLSSQTAMAAIESKPVPIDSRIKTFIFSENEVFRLVVHYGYQTSIEFADGEEIQTISVGNNYAWQLTPVGRRLFIKPLEENILTNMTILTNKRSYQFEVQSKLLSYTVDEELVYVVRFFYPDADFDKNKPRIAQAEKQELSIPSVEPMNFKYTLEGPESLAPTKIFDDGTNTFMKFEGDLMPKFEQLDDDKGTELTPRKRGEYVVLNTIASKFRLTLDNKIVTIFNENLIPRSNDGR